MKTIFDTVQLNAPKRSKFDLSHEWKGTIPFGALIPTMCQEVLPGDAFRVDTNTLARFQALLSPLMHRVNLYTHYFYVPNRIITRQWTRFISYQGNRPRESTFQSILPYFTIQGAKAQGTNGGAANALKDGSLLDYLGFPTAPNDVTFSADGTMDLLRINALFPLAYQRVWNDFYRDPNFTQPMFSEDSTSGVDPDALLKLDSIVGQITSQVIPNPEQSSPLLTITALEALLTLRWRSWEKDYLTVAQPHAQLGNSDVRVPITIPANSLGGGGSIPGTDTTIGRTGGIQYPGSANNPSDGGSFTVSALRVARALKLWLENSYRGGSRYAEQLWNHWMVASDDATIGQAQYLGGAIQPIVISEVVTTAPATPTQTNIPPASLVGHGISYSSSAGFTKKFKEHGVVIAITSVVPRTAYLYSMPRGFMRMEPLDFAFPEFAQLGEQPVLGSEVMFKLSGNTSLTAPNYTNIPVTANYHGITSRFPMGFVAPTSYLGFNLQNDQAEANTAGWGFQGRYSEYKYAPDTVHGLFRNSQSFWHLGRMLTPNIALNNAFVTSNPRMDVFSVLPNNGGAAGQYNQHPINLQVWNRVSVIRSLPYYNRPML